VNGVNFSIKVLDSKANLVYSFPDGSGISPNASGVVYDPAGAGAVATTVQAKLRETVSVKDFGAVGDGVADDTVAIQAAITYGQDNARAVYIPGGVYRTTTTLNITKRIRLFGDGMWQSRIVYAGASSAVQVSPPANGSSNTGYCFHDFGIQPFVDGGGVYGFLFYLQTNAYFSNWEMARVYVGDFGNYGVRLDNDVGNLNGFFTCTIRRCWIHNGINAPNIGDSITIAENTITGSRLTLPGILMSGLSGARQVVIRENNITTQAGSIAIFNMEQPQVMFNQMEHPAYLGNYTGPYGAQVYLSATSLGTIKGNTIATGASSVVGADSALTLVGASTYNVIEGNNIAKGENYDVVFANTTTVFNTLKQDNTYSTATNVVLNDGVNNAGVQVSLTPQNSWVSYAVDTAITVKKSEDGTVIVSGALKDGITVGGTLLTTLPVGFRPNRQKRFQVTNFNGAVFSTATVLVQTDGTVLLMSAAANTLLHLDGISFPLE
jgi:hypothetical protein